jgi:hypothetical protein
VPLLAQAQQQQQQQHSSSSTNPPTPCTLRCLEALITMGVLVPTGGDRTAEFFLSSFQERLTQQAKEREAKGQEYSGTFKPQRSKDEAKERRKQILSSIGEWRWLLLCAVLSCLQGAAQQAARAPALNRRAQLRAIHVLHHWAAQRAAAVRAAACMMLQAAASPSGDSPCRRAAPAHAPRSAT